MSSEEQEPFRSNSAHVEAQLARLRQNESRKVAKARALINSKAMSRKIAGEVPGTPREPSLRVTPMPASTAGEYAHARAALTMLSSTVAESHYPVVAQQQSSLLMDAYAFAAGVNTPDIDPRLATASTLSSTTSKHLQATSTVDAISSSASALHRVQTQLRQRAGVFLAVSEASQVGRETQPSPRTLAASTTSLAAPIAPAPHSPRRSSQWSRGIPAAAPALTVPASTTTTTTATARTRSTFEESRPTGPDRPATANFLSDVAASALAGHTAAQVLSGRESGAQAVLYVPVHTHPARGASASRSHRSRNAAATSARFSSGLPSGRLTADAAPHREVNSGSGNGRSSGSSSGGGGGSGGLGADLQESLAVWVRGCGWASVAEAVRAVEAAAETEVTAVSTAPTSPTAAAATAGGVCANDAGEEEFVEVDVEVEADGFTTRGDLTAGGAVLPTHALEQLLAVSSRNMPTDAPASSTTPHATVQHANHHMSAPPQALSPTRVHTHTASPQAEPSPAQLRRLATLLSCAAATTLTISVRNGAAATPSSADAAAEVLRAHMLDGTLQRATLALAREHPFTPLPLASMADYDRTRRASAPTTRHALRSRSLHHRLSTLARHVPAPVVTASTSTPLSPHPRRPSVSAAAAAPLSALPVVAAASAPGETLQQLTMQVEAHARALGVSASSLELRTFNPTQPPFPLPHSAPPGRGQPSHRLPPHVTVHSRAPTAFEGTRPRSLSPAAASRRPGVLMATAASLLSSRPTTTAAADAGAGSRGPSRPPSQSNAYALTRASSTRTRLRTMCSSSGVRGLSAAVGDALVHALNGDLLVGVSAHDMSEDVEAQEGFDEAEVSVAWDERPSLMEDNSAQTLARPTPDAAVAEASEERGTASTSTPVSLDVLRVHGTMTEIEPSVPTNGDAGVFSASPHARSRSAAPVATPVRLDGHASWHRLLHEHAAPALPPSVLSRLAADVEQHRTHMAVVRKDTTSASDASIAQFAPFHALLDATDAPLLGAASLPTPALTPSPPDADEATALPPLAFVPSRPPPTFASSQAILLPPAPPLPLLPSPIAAPPPAHMFAPYLFAEDLDYRYLHPVQARQPSPLPPCALAAMVAARMCSSLEQYRAHEDYAHTHAHGLAAPRTAALLSGPAARTLLAHLPPSPDASSPATLLPALAHLEAETPVPLLTTAAVQAVAWGPTSVAEHIRQVGQHCAHEYADKGAERGRGSRKPQAPLTPEDAALGQRLRLWHLSLHPLGACVYDPAAVYPYHTIPGPPPPPRGARQRALATQEAFAEAARGARDVWGAAAGESQGVSGVECAASTIMFRKGKPARRTRVYSAGAQLTTWAWGAGGGDDAEEEDSFAALQRAEEEAGRAQDAETHEFDVTFVPSDWEEEEDEDWEDLSEEEDERDTAGLASEHGGAGGAAVGAGTSAGTSAAAVTDCADGAVGVAIAGNSETNANIRVENMSCADADGTNAATSAGVLTDAMAEAAAASALGEDYVPPGASEGEDEDEEAPAVDVSALISVPVEAEIRVVRPKKGRTPEPVSEVPEGGTASDTRSTVGKKAVRFPHGVSTGRAGVGSGAGRRRRQGGAGDASTSPWGSASVSSLAVGADVSWRERVRRVAVVLRRGHSLAVRRGTVRGKGKSGGGAGEEGSGSGGGGAGDDELGLARAGEPGWSDESSDSSSSSSEEDDEDLAEDMLDGLAASDAAGGHGSTRSDAASDSDGSSSAGTDVNTAMAGAEVSIPDARTLMSPRSKLPFPSPFAGGAASQARQAATAGELPGEAARAAFMQSLVQRVNAVWRVFQLSVVEQEQWLVRVAADKGIVARRMRADAERLQVGDGAVVDEDVPLAAGARLLRVLWGWEQSARVYVQRTHVSRQLAALLPVAMETQRQAEAAHAATAGEGRTRQEKSKNAPSAPLSTVGTANLARMRLLVSRACEQRRAVAALAAQLVRCTSALGVVAVALWGSCGEQVTLAGVPLGEAVQRDYVLYRSAWAWLRDQRVEAFLHSVAHLATLPTGAEEAEAAARSMLGPACTVHPLVLPGELGRLIPVHLWSVQADASSRETVRTERMFARMFKLEQVGLGAAFRQGDGMRRERGTVGGEGGTGSGMGEEGENTAEEEEGDDEEDCVVVGDGLRVAEAVAGVSAATDLWELCADVVGAVVRAVAAPELSVGASASTDATAGARRAVAEEEQVVRVVGGVLDRAVAGDSAEPLLLRVPTVRTDWVQLPPADVSLAPADAMRLLRGATARAEPTPVPHALDAANGTQPARVRVRYPVRLLRLLQASLARSWEHEVRQRAAAQAAHAAAAASASLLGGVGRGVLDDGASVPWPMVLVEGTASLQDTPAASRTSSSLAAPRPGTRGGKNGRRGSRGTPAGWSMADYWALGRAEQDDETATSAAAVAPVEDKAASEEDPEAPIPVPVVEPRTTPSAPSQSLALVSGAALRPRSSFVALHPSHSSPPQDPSAAGPTSSLPQSLSKAAMAMRAPLPPASATTAFLSVVSPSTPQSTQPVLLPLQPLAVLTATSLRVALARTATQARAQSRGGSSHVGTRHLPTAVARRERIGSREATAVRQREATGREPIPGIGGGAILRNAPRPTSQAGPVETRVKAMSMAKLAAIQTLNLTKNNKL